MDTVFSGALHWLSTAPAAFLGELEYSSLGAAYLVLLANGLGATLGFALARAYLVVSPNTAARDYGLYVSAMLLAAASGMVIENELRPTGALLPYAAAPHLALLLALHLAVYWRQTPWLVTLAAASLASLLPIVALLGALTPGSRLAPGLALALAVALLIFVWRKCVTTKRSFVRAQSIHVGTKELRPLAPRRQTPWLGLPQWVALGLASLALATVNELLRGSLLMQVPAAAVGIEASGLLAVTVLVSSIPAGSYWLARKTWMPELARVVWLVWLVAAFAFTYGNVVGRPSAA